MKPRPTAFICFGLLLSFPISATLANAKEKNVREAAAPHGSIRPKGRPNATERAALAKIDFLTAQKVALTAVPGNLIYGELEVEDGNLQYSFQVITAAGKVVDVGVDAGNGKVLSAEEGDNE